jgi:hypothetical protein
MNPPSKPDHKPTALNDADDRYRVIWEDRFDAQATHLESKKDP